MLRAFRNVLRCVEKRAQTRALGHSQGGFGSKIFAVVDGL